MTDKLIVSDLAEDCRIGIFDWEQKNPQTIWIDLELEIDVGAAASQSDAQPTVDYGKLITSVRQLVRSKTYRLLEELAELIASAILKQFQTNAVLVRVKKRALPGIGYAAVELKRRK